jgi:hypothetical protein
MSFLVITGIFFKFFASFFETFYRLHWILFIGVFVFSFIHGVELVLYIAGPIFLFDLLVRGLFACIYRKSTKKLKLEKIENLDVVKMSWNKKESGLRYKAG